jgi:enamine deaminase RidA (YjgF/YER057c/UK114 family)
VERRTVNPWTWQDNFGYSQAIEVSGAQRTIFCAGQTSTDDEGSPVHPEDMHAQINYAFDNLETVLRESGAGLSDVVRLNYYTTDVDRFSRHTTLSSVAWQQLAVSQAVRCWACRGWPFLNSWSRSRPQR